MVETLGRLIGYLLLQSWIVYKLQFNAFLAIHDGGANDTISPTLSLTLFILNNVGDCCQRDWYTGSGQAY